MWEAAAGMRKLPGGTEAEVMEKGRLPGCSVGFTICFRTNCLGMTSAQQGQALPQKSSIKVASSQMTPDCVKLTNNNNNNKVNKLTNTKLTSTQYYSQQPPGKQRKRKALREWKM